MSNVVVVSNGADIKNFFKLYHCSSLGGHLGIDKMKKTIAQFYTWTNMNEDIEHYVRNCVICEKTKVIQNTKVPMQITSIGDSLFDHTFVDFVGPMPNESEEGHKYIFTATCDLTQMLIAIPTKDTTAKTTAECLLEHVLLRYNFPSRIISDRGTNFTSKIIRQLASMLELKKHFTTAYRAQANKVERKHRSLNAYLRAYVTNNEKQWHKLLKYATFAYNNSVHSTTNYTPHELAHGFVTKLPRKFKKASQKLPDTYDEYVKEVANHIGEACVLAKEFLTKRKHINKQYYDKKSNDIVLAENDLIYVRAQQNNKFTPPYHGPYRVKSVDASDVEYIKGGKVEKINRDHVKKSIAKHTSEPPETVPVIHLEENDLFSFFIQET